MNLSGVDISSHQGNIDLAALSIDFCIIKATEGNSYVNPYCDSKYQQAKSLGLLRGVYHFATGRTSGKEEAEWFLKNIEGYIGDAILVLDWEASAVNRGVAYAKEFMDTVYNKTGVKPLIYMSRSVIDRYDFTPLVNADYGLWLATLDGKEYSSYGEFPLVAMCQVWAKPMTGYNADIDQDIFYGDEKAWKAYQGKADTSSKPVSTGTKYHVGQKVRFSTCYRSSTEPIGQAIPASKMLRNYGTITAVYPGTHNPYLLDDGLCFVNDGDIREVIG
mgnify:CR=1 FL=1